MAQRTAVHAYLTDYARDHGLMQRMRLNTEVVGMARRKSGLPGWTLEIRNPDAVSPARNLTSSRSAPASSMNAKRSATRRRSFKAAGGVILHSAQYTDPAIVKGKKVVVLGGSKSATDIAVNAVNAGASEVTLVYREPVWRIPYFIGGLLNFKRILYIRAQEEMFRGWGLSTMSRISHASPNRSSGRTGAGWKACSRCS